MVSVSRHTREKVFFFRTVFVLICDALRFLAGHDENIRKLDNNDHLHPAMANRQ